jgi:hypothetical protein
MVSLPLPVLIVPTLSMPSSPMEVPMMMSSPSPVLIAPTLLMPSPIPSRLVTVPVI